MLEDKIKVVYAFTTFRELRKHTSTLGFEEVCFKGRGQRTLRLC